LDIKTNELFTVTRTTCTRKQNVSLTQSFRPHCDPGVAPSTMNISWVCKDGLRIGLTILPSSCADCLEIWQPQLRGALRACPSLYRDCFTLTCKLNWHYVTFALLLFLLQVQGNQFSALFHLSGESLLCFPCNWVSWHHLWTN